MVEPLTQSPASARPDDDAFRQLVEAHEPALRAHCYRMLASFDEAEDAFKRALAARPDYALAFANLARVAKMRGQLDEAREYAILAERLEAMGEGKGVEA